MVDTPTTRSIRQAAFSVLSLFGFYRTSIQVWRNPSASVSPVLVGTVAGGIVPASAAAAAALPPIDDFAGARGDFISYTYGTIAVQDGDELHLIEDSGTAIYPVEGVSQWNAVQIGNLTEVRHA